MAKKDLTQAEPVAIPSQALDEIDDSHLSDAEIDALFPVPFRFARPTLYRNSFCRKVIEWGAQGETIAYMCSQMCIGVRTFSNWLEERPAFAQAYEIAKANSQNHYEQLAKKHMIETKDGDKLNTTLYKLHMTSHFKEFYSNTEFTIVNKDKSNAEIPAAIRETVAALEEKIRNGNKPASKNA